MWKPRSLIPIVVAGAVGFSGAYALMAPEQVVPVARLALGSFGGAGCDIKGNVSINSGERIYHIPGQRYYSETVIRPEYGERYFCSEAEARAAGWRRSGV
jgi:hypothetical protein